MTVIDLSALSSNSVLFAYMDVLPAHAAYCARHMSAHVRVSTITTNNGRKKRKIYAPDRLLSWIQNRIRSQLLLQLPVEDQVHGFVRSRGIVTNASAHALGRRAWVMNVDLKDFFPSINSRRVHGFFHTVFGLPPAQASILARLTTHDQHLAQGFCTSPDIANFVAWRLDRRLAGLARAHDLVYTRYADDLTLSSRNASTSPDKILNRLRGIVVDEGFVVNERKIAIMRAGRRQRVTGLVVSDQGTVNIPRRVRRLLRSAVHHWPQQTPERRASIMGWINYMNSVDPQGAARLLAAIPVSEDRSWSKGVGTHPFAEDIASVNRIVKEQS